AVVQGAFTVSADVASSDERADRGGRDLKVDSVQMTQKKRPPTRHEGSQGRHTVSWQAKTLYWSALLSGKTYDEVVATLLRLAYEDEAIDAATGAADDARMLRRQL